MFKKIALVAALAAIGFNSAFAASFDEASTGTTNAISSAGDYDFTGTFAAGSMVDTWTFTLGSGLSLSEAGIGSIKISLKPFAVTSPAFSVVYNGVTYAAPSGEVELTPVAGAVQKFELTGTTASSYAGSLTVTAVPEPETYAMFLAGLGIMGAIARRRSNKA